MCHICVQDPSLHGQNNLGGLDYERYVGKGLQILLAARGVIGQTLAMGHLTSILSRFYSKACGRANRKGPVTGRVVSSAKEQIQKTKNKNNKLKSRCTTTTHSHRSRPSASPTCHTQSRRRWCSGRSGRSGRSQHSQRSQRGRCSRRSRCDSGTRSSAA